MPSLPQSRSEDKHNFEDEGIPSEELEDRRVEEKEPQ
jgi:hypothetical protein